MKPEGRWRAEVSPRGAGMTVCRKSSQDDGAKGRGRRSQREEEILEAEAEEGTEEVQEEIRTASIRCGRPCRPRPPRRRERREKKRSEDRTGLSFSQLIEDHNILLVGRSRRKRLPRLPGPFAGAIIMGAGLHIRVKARAHYSGTSTTGFRFRAATSHWVGRQRAGHRA
jgi:hypothetical protein